MQEYTDDLIAWWAQDYSLPMYDDGIIYYKAPKSHYRKVFKRIERQTGLNFERVRNPDKAEIICEVKYEDDGYYGYAAFNTAVPGKFRLSVDGKKRRYKKTMAHEIGHALGLGHTDNTRQDTVMSYGSYWQDNKYLSPTDLSAISEIFPINYLT